MYILNCDYWFVSDIKMIFISNWNSLWFINSLYEENITNKVWFHERVFIFYKIWDCAKFEIKYFLSIYYGFVKRWIQSFINLYFQVTHQAAHLWYCSSLSDANLHHSRNASHPVKEILFQLQLTLFFVYIYFTM